VLGALALVLALVLGWFGWVWSSYRGIERIDLAAVLDPVSGDSVNYLLVGSDSRANLDPEAPAGATRPTVSGQRSDTIILLRVGPQGALMMSIPRDLWVTIADTGKKAKVNAAYNTGAANLVATVKANLGVPVNHYAEVDFGSFAGVVDAVGGVTIDFPHPVTDKNSGLNVTTTGPVVLDGTQALAYVRSRHYVETIDGKQVEDPRADIGREERQRQFLVTALKDVGNNRNPVALGRATSSLSQGLVLDNSVGVLDAFSLARKLGGAAPESVVLPTTPAQRGGQAVLLLKDPQAQAVLARFR